MSSNNKSAATKRDILDAAWSLVAAKGAEVSMAEIAKVAGVSRQAVYLHFTSRGGLLMALVKRADERFHIREDFTTAIEIHDPHARLKKCLTIWFSFVEKIVPVATDLIRLRATDPDAASAWQDRMNDLKAWHNQLTASLEKEDALMPGWTAIEAADYLWATSSVQAWSLLAVECGWGFDKTAKTLTKTITETLLGAAD